MSSFTLKMIALITMLIDHIGAVFFPEIMAFRFIGRLSFPIYAFLLVQGYIHTSTDKLRLQKYISRLLLFAFISEISFDLCFYQQPIYLEYQNIYFTLFLGIISIALYELIEDKGKDGFYVILASCVLAFLFKTDYNMIGIIIIFAFYFAEKSKKENKNSTLQKILLTLTFVILALIEITLNSYDLTFKSIVTTFTQFTWVYLGMILSLIPISRYNGKLGFKTKTSKLIFYWFYPVHLTILYVISCLINAA